MDKNINNTFCPVSAFVLEEISNAEEDIDAMVVTPIFAYDEVARELKDKVNCDIVSLEDVVFDL